MDLNERICRGLIIRSNGEMKPVFIVLQVIAGIIFLCGSGILMSGSSLPVYTDPRAPEELSNKLQDLPSDQRFSQWYEDLAKFETRHKSLTDLGRGLMAFGIGISIATLFIHGLSKARPNRVRLWIRLYWTLLWGIKFPLTMWYYTVRQLRFEYPVWGDSIAIGIFQSWFLWVVGLIVTSVLLAILMIRYQYATCIALYRPHGIWGWFRAIALSLWLLLLAACIYPAIPGGDEGMVISCTAAITVILLALSAPGQRHIKASLLAPEPPQVGAAPTNTTLTHQSGPAPGQA